MKTTLIIGLVALSSISAFADCSISLSGASRKEFRTIKKVLVSKGYSVQKELDITIPAVRYSAKWVAVFASPTDRFGQAQIGYKNVLVESIEFFPANSTQADLKLDISELEKIPKC